MRRESGAAPRTACTLQSPCRQVTHGVPLYTAQRCPCCAAPGLAASWLRVVWGSCCVRSNKPNRAGRAADSAQTAATVRSSTRYDGRDRAATCLGLFGGFIAAVCRVCAECVREWRRAAGRRQRQRVLQRGAEGFASYIKRRGRLATTTREPELNKCSAERKESGRLLIAGRPQPGYLDKRVAVRAAEMKSRWEMPGAAAAASQGMLREPARTSDPAGWLMCFRQALRQALINF